MYTAEKLRHHWESNMGTFYPSVRNYNWKIHLGYFKSFVRFNVVSFVTPYLNIYIFSIVSWYVLIDREFCTLFIFFQILIVCLFSAHYCMMLLTIFGQFSLRIQIEPKHCPNSPNN